MPAPEYRPQLATLVKQAPEGPEWLHEIKEFVIGGLTDPEGARAGLGALLAGYFQGLRADKPAADVRREEAAGISAPPDSVLGVRITHPDTSSLDPAVFTVSSVPVRLKKLMKQKLTRSALQAVGL